MLANGGVRDPGPDGSVPPEIRMEFRLRKQSLFPRAMDRGVGVVTDGSSDGSAVARRVMIPLIKKPGAREGPSTPRLREKKLQHVLAQKWNNLRFTANLNSK